MILADNVVPEQGDFRAASLPENCTVQQNLYLWCMYPWCKIQNLQEYAGLDSNSYVPFFWADGTDEMIIMLI